MKKFKTFLLSIILISVLTLSIVLCACKNDNNEQPPSDDLRNVDWIKIYNADNLELKHANYWVIANNVEHINYICEEDTSRIFKKGKYESNKELIEKLEKYDEKFFKNKSLVILFRCQDSGDYYVKDFEIIDETLNITLARDAKSGAFYPCDTITWERVYLLELDKEKIQDVTKINVNEIEIKQ